MFAQDIAAFLVGAVIAAMAAKDSMAAEPTMPVTASAAKEARVSIAAGAEIVALCAIDAKAARAQLRRGSGAGYSDSQACQACLLGVLSYNVSDLRWRHGITGSLFS